MQIAGERTLLLTDGAYHRLAGNLATWPQGIPAHAGMHAVMADLAGQPTHTLLVQTTLPGGYHLLVGRDLARFLELLFDRAEREDGAGERPAAAEPGTAGVTPEPMPLESLLRRFGIDE